jgi:hypothetical protein
MKNAIVVLVLLMAVLVVNGNTASTSAQQDKPVRTTVMASDLPQAITDNIAKDYAGYTIKEATSVNLNGAITYEVVVSKGTMTETLVYDKDGKFLKKLPPAKDKQ